MFTCTGSHLSEKFFLQTCHLFYPRVRLNQNERGYLGIVPAVGPIQYIYIYLNTYQIKPQGPYLMLIC